MVDHEQIFKTIKDLLSRYTTITVYEVDYGTHLTIEQTGIWMECDRQELTIGYGLAHMHYKSKA
jgi:hypothetical protein